MESLLKDVRYGVRGLLKRPGFTAIAIITLALGIGANTAIFSVVNTVLLRPLPFRAPGELVTLWERNPKQGYEQNPPAAGNFVDWRDQNRVFAQMAIYAPSRKFNLALGDQPERISGAAVSSSLFELLGVRPVQGRTFSSEEEQPGNDQVALISHNLWQRHFAADLNPVGRTITLDSRPHTIVGVMPEGFQFPGGSGTVLRIFTPAPAELWVPLALDADTLRQRSSHSLNVIGRLKPGVTVEQATTEMDAIQQRLEQQYPTFFIGSNVKLVPLPEQIVGTARRPLLVLWGAVVFVLLISCANVANLLLSRSSSRKKEFALRTALGAGRTRIIRQLLTESLLLSFAGGIAGALLAAWGVHVLSTIVPLDFPRREEIAIDGWVLGFTLLVSMLTGIIFGLAPAIQSTKMDLTDALKSSGRNSAGSSHRHSLRSLLVMSEMALALILLIGAALMIQSFLRLRQVGAGFSSDNVLTMELSLPRNSYPRDRRPDFFQQLIERTKSVPGVQLVAAAKSLPLSVDNMNFAFDIEGRPFPPGRSPGADCRFVTADYFKALRIPLIKGRGFSQSDGPQAPHVLLINNTMADRFFPNEDPIGKRLELGINSFNGEIIGIVGNVKHVALDADVNSEVYAPYSQAPFWADMTLLVRTSGDPMSLAGAMRNELGTLDKQVSIGKVRTMDTIAAESVAQPRFRTLLLGVFGISALLLASVGIYGVMSYAVTQRTQEIGIRMALGAQVGDVRKLVIRNGMTLALVGVTIGLAGAFGLTRLMASLLFGISATDVPTFAAISVGLVAVALIACYIPARRATKVDPLVALRYE
ncbi:MAG: ABC transporter permease [Pyrinomonadaceae bacterium]|nr:ABC transporter permease [Pyrinomonadaceae bacterium]